jgi:hypothetical protein
MMVGWWLVPFSHYHFPIDILLQWLYNRDSIQL